MPGERTGANVFPYLRTQGIIELAVDVASKPFVNKRIEELADMTWQLPGQRQSQCVFPGLVIDGFCSITLPVLEVSVYYPVMRQLESRTNNVADRTDNRVRFPRAHLRQIHARKARNQRLSGAIERIRSRDNKRGGETSNRRYRRSR